MEADIICVDCKYLEKDLKCKAFPNGIPDIILSGENDHSEPLRGQQNNIVFENKDS